MLAISKLAENVKFRSIIRRRRKEIDFGRHFSLVISLATGLSLSGQLFAALQRIGRA